MNLTTKFISLTALATASLGLLVVGESVSGQATTRPAAVAPTTAPSGRASAFAPAASTPRSAAAAPTTRSTGLAAAPTTRSTVLAAAPTTRSTTVAAGATTRAGTASALGGNSLRGTTGTIGGSTGLFGPSRGGATTRGSTAGVTSALPNRGVTSVPPRSTPVVPRNDIAQIRAPDPMPYEYSYEFAQRSMFQKGLPQVAPAVVVDTAPVGPDPSVLAQQQRDAEMARLERSLIFNGASIENNQAVGFIEDITTFTVTRVKKADSVARGKIGNITLSGLEYIVNGRVATIAMGNSLAGQAVLRSATMPSQVEINQMVANLAATQKSGDTATPDDLLTQMKLRRLKELGQLTLPDASAPAKPAGAQPTDQPVDQSAEPAPADDANQ